MLRFRFNALILSISQVVGVINSLLGVEFITAEKRMEEGLSVSSEGNNVTREGSPEWRLFQAVPADGGIMKSALEVIFSSHARAMNFLRVAVTFPSLTRARSPAAAAAGV